MREYMSKEEVDEKTEENESRRIEPNVVSLHKVLNGYLLREGDMVYVNTWKDFQKVSNNLHDDKRYELPEDHKDRALALIPVNCHKDRKTEKSDELKGTHLLAVSNRNARDFSRLLLDAEMSEAFVEKESWVEQESTAEDEETESEFICPFCGKEYEIEGYFKKHIKSCQSDESEQS